jgi:hypothetical protein
MLKLLSSLINNQSTGIDRRREQDEMHPHDARAHLCHIVPVDVGRVAQYGHEAGDLDFGVARCQGAEGEAGHVGADFVEAVVVDFPLGAGNAR